MNRWFSRIGQNCLTLKSHFISSSIPFQGQVLALFKKQHQVMIGLVHTIHGHVTEFDYHIEALFSPPEETDKTRWMMTEQSK